MAKDDDIIRWITYRGRKIPIKKGMEGKFKQKIEEIKNKDKQANDKKEISDNIRKKDIDKEKDKKDLEKNKEKKINKEEKETKTISEEERKQKIKELEDKRDKTQGFIQKGEIQEEIDMLKDDFKGTKEEYREYISKEQERRLQEYKKEKEERINKFKQENNESDDYRMAHRPTETGLTADDLTKKGNEVELPSDIYEHPEYYSSNNKEWLKETTEQLDKARNNPDAEITIYRATPGNKINEGDWVSLSKKYVEAHNEGQLDGKGNILEMKVPAKDVQFAGDTLEEWGYFPKKGKTGNFSDKEVNNYKPKHLYDVGYEPEHEGLKYANKHNKFSNEKTMPDGNVIGANDKEGLKDIGGPTVSYTMSNERYYNLSNDEKKAINKIISNNKEAERLEAQSTDIINNKSSRKDWKKHLGEAGEHTHEIKDGKGYYDELSTKDKTRIINNDKRIEELKQDSIKQAKILDNGPTHGKYSLDSDNDEKWSNYNIKESNSTKKERSSGVIVLDNGRVLLVENDDGSYGFPKGHAEKGETLRKTATRELLEETNYNAKIKDNFRVATKYTTESGRTKTDVYFVGEPDKNSKIIPREGEIKGAKFYTIDEARKKLNGYDNLINILDRAAKSSSKKEDIPPVRKLRTLSDIERYYINQGYSKATALKYAKQEIRERKRK